METIKKNDFIEIEFTGKSNNEIFDTTNKEEAKEIGLETDVKPFIVSVGNEMLLKGLDEFLEGKEIGKKYSIHLSPEKAFGKRNPGLIKLIPMRIFKEKNINPVSGMALQLDDNIVKIISVSGGRIMVDFNNSLAGKDVDYDFKILKKIINDKEKINALQDYFFKQQFDFVINEKKVIFSDKKISPIVEMMAEKFKSMTGFDFEVKKNEVKVEEKEEKQEKQEEEPDKK